MQPFFTSILTTTFGGQFAPKKGGQFDRIFQLSLHRLLIYTKPFAAIILIISIIIL